VDVTGGAPNAQSYTDNGDMTITDNVTGLMWQKAVAPGTYTQPMAVAYCPTLALGGHRDWRLPTIIELVSLVDVGSSNPSIDPAFASTPSDLFWSSSPAAGVSAAWLVAFRGGSTYPTGLSNEGDVRCVR